MYKYFDIDDMGNSSVAVGAEIDEFETFSPEWKEYQKRWKDLVKQGMSKDEAKKQAQTELGYKPGSKLFEKIRNVNVGEGEVKVGLKPKSTGSDAGNAPEGGEDIDDSETTKSSGLNLFGMTIPWLAVVGVVAVGGFFVYKKMGK
jgi:hypothetical protein